MVTRPCLCGLDRWPGRLCGFTDKAADGAPRWTTGLVSPGQVGVPPAPDSLTLTAGRATGEIQGQSPGLLPTLALSELPREPSTSDLAPHRAPPYPACPPRPSFS